MRTRGSRFECSCWEGGKPLVLAEQEDGVAASASHLAPRVCRHSFAKNFVFENRKKGNVVSFVRVLVGEHFSRFWRTTNDTSGREFRWKYRLRHPLEFEPRARCAAPHWFVQSLLLLLLLSRIFYTAYTSYRSIPPMNRCFHSQILFSFRFFVVFLLVFLLFFFWNKFIFRPRREIFILSRVISVSLLTGSSLLVSILSGFCTRVINFVPRFYLTWLFKLCSIKNNKIPLYRIFKSIVHIISVYKKERERERWDFRDNSIILLETVHNLQGWFFFSRERDSSLWSQNRLCRCKTDFSTSIRNEINFILVDVDR